MLLLKKGKNQHEFVVQKTAEMATHFVISEEAVMLKLRIQGTKNDIRWFIRLLKSDSRFQVENKFFISDF